MGEGERESEQAPVIRMSRWGKVDFCFFLVLLFCLNPSCFL